MLIGFQYAPLWIFYVALILLNLVLYQTNKTRPIRHDYNLFLREAMGQFGVAESMPEPRRVTQTELLAFARFLGTRFLACTCSIRNGTLTLRLPPVRAGMEQYFAPGLGCTSHVTLSGTGKCEAKLGSRDIQALRSLGHEHNDTANLEHGVARVVETALGLFLGGHRGEAERLLQAEADEAVFVQPIADSREHRWRGRIAIYASIVMLACVLMLDVASDFASSSPEKTVSPAMAQEAIREWIRGYTPANRAYLMGMLSNPCLPPLDFLNAEDTVKLKQIVKDLSMDLLPSAGHYTSEARTLANLRYCNRLYNVMDINLLSEEELHALGVSPEAIRAAAASLPVNTMDWWTTLPSKERSMGRIPGQYRPIGLAGLGVHATQLACLELSGCMDIIDRDGMAQLIAAQQVGHINFDAADYDGLDTGRARGLFVFSYCGMGDTYGALRSLDILGRLELIDRDACIEAILRFYRGRGEFKNYDLDNNIRIHGSEDDSYYALESLVILDAIDRIKDLDHWEFSMLTQTIRRSGGKVIVENAITGDTIKSWAYQCRLEEIRANR